MSRSQLNFVLVSIVACLTMLFSMYVAAQANSDVLQKNEDAMDAYANLEIGTAISLLEDAEQLCMDSNITGPQLARTFVNRGVVEMGGNGDSARAMEYFKKALCQDSAVMLDPLNSTPDIADIFKGAQAQINSQGCEGIGPPVGGTEPTVDDLLTASASSPSAGSTEPDYQSSGSDGESFEVVNDVLRHRTVSQQKRLVPIPFYVTTNSDLDVASVVTFYRTVGERIFQQLPLVRKGDGWSAYIECDVLTTLDPTAIEYYIAVSDPSGQLLSTAGSEAQPFTINIGDSVSSAPPGVPGETPLPACEEDCPPWNPDCNNRNCKKFADLCSEEEPCCSGMSCVDGVCEEAGGDEAEYVNTKGADTKIRFYLAGGTGVGFVPKEKYTQDDFPNMRSVTAVTTDKPGVAMSKLHVRVGAMVSLTEKFELGINFRGDLPLFPGFYDAIVPSVLVNAGYRIAGTNAEKGFQMFGVFGMGWVQIMQRIPFKDCKEYQEVVEGGETVERCSDPEGWFDDPNAKLSTSGFRKAGFLGVEFGLDMNYWFVRNVGVHVGTIFDITFPENVTVNLDVQAGLALRF